MLKISLWDLEFAHIPDSYHDCAKSKYIEWDRDNYNNEIIIYSERCFEKVRDPKSKGKKNGAWCLEPKVVHAYGYEKLKNGMHKEFDFVLTFDENFATWLKENSNAKPVFWSPAGNWIKKEDHAIYPKSKLVQMIASKKDYAVGHKLRFEVARRFEHKIDKYGWAFQPFKQTVNVFKDYMFAVVIENCNIPEYFSDKLTSAFYTGTVPIMWNSGWIGKYFDTKGMILWNDINELDDIRNDLSEAKYKSMEKAIQDNFEIAKKYYCPEDTIYSELKKQGIIE